MLLLIRIFSWNCCGYSSFNTSHVTINHRRPALPAKCKGRFNTSHVTINRCSSSHPRSASVKVSIHLMLLLICAGASFKYSYTRCFNTSHVTINPLAPALYLFRFPSFNTSHVTINQLHIRYYIRLVEFQYISCYY